MRYTKEVRFQFVGDRATAQRYIPQARVALGELTNVHLDLGGLMQMRRSVTLPDGTVFHINANRYLPSVTIDVRGADVLLPRDIFISGYSTAPGSNIPIKGWLEGLLYVEHGEQEGEPKKLYAPAQVVWSPNDEAAIRSAGSVVNWGELPFVIGHNVKMKGYELPLHEPRYIGDYANLPDLGLPAGGPLQERVIDGENRLYLLYSTQPSEVPDNTTGILATFAWPGRITAITQIRGAMIVQYPSLSYDNTYVWFVGQGIPEGQTRPPGTDILHNPYTLNRVTKATGAIAQLTYYSFPSTDNITVLVLGNITTNEGTKLISCRIRDLTLPGGDSVARYHPFAYMNPANGGIGILDTCFWLINAGIAGTIVDTFYAGNSTLFAAQNTLSVFFHESTEGTPGSTVRYVYCVMQMSNTNTGTVNRRMLIKMEVDTQEVVGSLLMEDVYIIKIRGDGKDIYFNARLGAQTLNGNMTSGGLRAGLFRIPKGDFSGEVDPEAAHLIWERTDPSTPEDFDLIYTGPDT